MAAIVKGNTTMQFGVSTHTAVIMQSLDWTVSNEVAEARDEDGDVTAIAIYGGERLNGTCEYIYKGGDLGTLGATITLTGINWTAGSLYLTEFGQKESNTGFKTGSAKVIGVKGITG